MLSLKTNFFLIVTFLVIHAVPVQSLRADSDSSQIRNQLNVRGLQKVLRFSRTRHVFQEGRRRFKRIDPLVIRGRLPGIGPVTIKLNRRRVSKWQVYAVRDGVRVASKEDAPVLLSGRAFLGRPHSEREQEVVPVALSLYGTGEAQQLVLSFVARGRGRKIKLYQLRGVFPLSNSAHSNSLSVSVTRVSKHPIEPQGCASQASDEIHAAAISSAQSGSRQASRSVSAPASEGSLWADVVAQADFEYFSRYGASGAANRIEATLHEVDALYGSDLSVHFNGATIAILTASAAPYQGLTTSGQILNAFTNYNALAGGPDLPAADVYHLFSGKAFESNVIGLAWVGGVCAESLGVYLGFGISSDQASQALNKIVVGHEIGHNFGAEHTAGGIMAAVATDATFAFSAASKSQISNYLSSLSAGQMCLEEKTASTPQPTSSATPTPSITPGGGGGGSGGSGGAGAPPDYYLVISKERSSIDQRKRKPKKSKDVVVKLFNAANQVVAGETIQLIRIKGKRKEVEYLSLVADEAGEVRFTGINKPWKVKGRVIIDGVQTFESRAIRVLKKPKKKR